MNPEQLVKSRNKISDEKTNLMESEEIFWTAEDENKSEKWKWENTKEKLKYLNNKI